jgi:hypothetical protein
VSDHAKGRRLGVKKSGIKDVAMDCGESDIYIQRVRTIFKSCISESNQHQFLRAKTLSSITSHAKIQVQSASRHPPQSFETHAHVVYASTVYLEYFEVVGSWLYAWAVTVLVRALGMSVWF